MHNEKKIQCDYCPNCIKKNSSGFDKFGRWIPPQFEEYECMRTLRSLGNRSRLYMAPDWCPKLQEQNKGK